MVDALLKPLSTGRGYTLGHVARHLANARNVLAREESKLVSAAGHHPEHAILRYGVEPVGRGFEPALSKGRDYCEWVCEIGLLDPDTLTQIHNLKPNDIGKTQIDLLLQSYLEAARYKNIDLLNYYWKLKEKDQYAWWIGSRIHPGVSDMIHVVRDHCLLRTNPRNRLFAVDLENLGISKFERDRNTRKREEYIINVVLPSMKRQMNMAYPLACNRQGYINIPRQELPHIDSSIVDFDQSPIGGIMVRSPQDLEVEFVRIGSNGDAIALPKLEHPALASFEMHTLLIRSNSNNDYRASDLQFINQCLVTVKRLLELRKQTTIDEKAFLRGGGKQNVRDTGMDRYIPASTEARDYNEAQRFHAGRAEAREKIIIPHLQKIGAKRIAEMGPADGLTSTIRYCQEISGVKIDAIEYSGGYYEALAENCRSKKEMAMVRPLKVSIEDYVPEEPNNLDAFVSTGAFTDFSPDHKDWVRVLRHVREKCLKPGGCVILEEEIVPWHPKKERNSREKAHAIQRGEVILDGMLQNKWVVGQEELKALLSSLHGMADYKGRLVDFENVFHEAGFQNLHWVKVWPTKRHSIIQLTPQNLIVAPDKFDWLPPGANGIDRFNFIVNQVLEVDGRVPEPFLDFRYFRASRAMKGLHESVARDALSPNRERNLKEHLDLDLVTGQDLQTGDEPKFDQTGGVYVLIAS